MNLYKVFLLSLVLLFMNTLNSQITFTCNDNLNNWVIVNDGVMGGVSTSDLKVNNDCNAFFSGLVSLENNGGFASVRCFPKQNIQINNQGKIILKIKGDGKTYQFRIKLDDDEYFSYIYAFETSGNWETIILSLADFYPSFRGRKLADASDVNIEGNLSYFSFLIANKRNEAFNIEFQSIDFK